MRLSTQTLALVLKTRDKLEEAHKKHKINTRVLVMYKTKKNTENPKLNLNHQQFLVASTSAKLFICVFLQLCTIVPHNAALNSSDNLHSYPPDNHHCSNPVHYNLVMCK